MKKCPNCNNTYNDDMGYCPTCGTQLIPIQSVNPDPIPNPNPNPTPNQHNTQSTSNSGLMNWLPYILAVAGVAVSWFIDAIFGFVLALAGLGLAIMTRSKRNSPVIAIVVTAVAVIIIFYWLITYM